jgi:hypothetical protein
LAERADASQGESARVLLGGVGIDRDLVFGTEHLDVGERARMSPEPITDTATGIAIEYLAGSSLDKPETIGCVSLRRCRHSAALVER